MNLEKRMRENSKSIKRMSYEKTLKEAKLPLKVYSLTLMHCTLTTA